MIDDVPLPHYVPFITIPTEITKNKKDLLKFGKIYLYTKLVED